MGRQGKWKINAGSTDTIDSCASSASESLENGYDGIVCILLDERIWQNCKRIKLGDGATEKTTVVGDMNGLYRRS